MFRNIHSFDYVSLDHVTYCYSEIQTIHDFEISIHNCLAAAIIEADLQYFNFLF